MTRPELDRADQRTWLPWLRSSAERFATMLEDTPDEWLKRRIEMIDTPGSLSGGRMLMMMLERDGRLVVSLDACLENPQLRVEVRR